MHNAVLLAGFAAVVAASPAPQGINFASINAAPSPSLTGPPTAGNTQVISYNSASIAAIGSAAVTDVASASATALQNGNAKRNFINWWPWGGGQQGSPSTSCTKTTSTSTTPVQTSTTPVQTTTTPAQSTTTSAPITSVQPTTSTTTPGTPPTTTTSSDGACATTPEAGTYCGFINPEDPCAPQPDGYGPQVQPDTVAAFAAYAPFASAAQNAVAPAGYASTFTNLNASVSANTYLGLQTFQSYDVNLCAAYCNNQTLCTGFNIFVERDPSLNPSDNCTLPSSITNYKCTLWGSGVDAASATNFGDYRGAFQVIIAGSDGFQKTNNTAPAPAPGWQAPQQCGNGGSQAHSHPSTCIGTKFFPGPYNPALCASYAGAQNSVNQKSPWWFNIFAKFFGGYNPLQCNFFNSYMLKKNGVGLGTFCGLYAQQYSPGSATYTPGWQGSDFWNIESSYSYCIAK